MKEYCPQLLAISASVAGSVTKEDLLFYLSLAISVLTLIQKALDAREDRRRREEENKEK